MKPGIFIFYVFVLLMSCTSGTPDEKAFLASLDSARTTQAVDKQLISGILEQIPSPLETSVLLKQSGIAYNADYLNSPDNVSNYNTNHKKALNLGIYGTDLGYTNIYEKKLDGIRYLSSIKSLSNDLNIGQFFDVATISRLAANSNNLDSLLLMTTQNFNSINAYLQEQGRENLCVLFLMGGWVEAMKITCQVTVLNRGQKSLLETIGAQKIVLEQLILLLSLYEKDPVMAALLADFKALETAFRPVVISYVYKESTMKVVDGVAVIQDNSTTTITISDEDVANINAAINTIRNKMTR
jgi:hypothetical protein